MMVEISGCLRWHEPLEALNDLYEDQLQFLQTSAITFDNGETASYR